MHNLRALEKPEPDRTITLTLLTRELRQRQGNPAMEDRIVSRFLPSIGSINQGGNELNAHQRVLLASAAVLDYRNSTGKWPERLSDAMESVPDDPYNPAVPVRYRREGEGFIIEAGTPEVAYYDHEARIQIGRGAVFSFPNRYAMLSAAQRRQVAARRRSTAPLLKPVRQN